MTRFEPASRMIDALKIPTDASLSEGAAYRSAMRELVAGVCLVTTGEGANRAGCAATAVTSLSTAPPTLLVCLNLGSSTLARLRAEGVFAINVLGGEHRALVGRFSGQDGVDGPARFDAGVWAPMLTGAPTLVDALAVFDCRVETLVEHRTHAIVMGAVQAVRRSEGMEALVHWRGRSEPLR